MTRKKMNGVSIQTGKREFIARDPKGSGAILYGNTFIKNGKEMRFSDFSRAGNKDATEPLTYADRRGDSTDLAITFDRDGVVMMIFAERFKSAWLPENYDSDNQDLPEGYEYLAARYFCDRFIKLAHGPYCRGGLGQGSPESSLKETVSRWGIDSEKLADVDVNNLGFVHNAPGSSGNKSIFTHIHINGDLDIENIQGDEATFAVPLGNAYKAFTEGWFQRSDAQTAFLVQSAYIAMILS